MNLYSWSFLTVEPVVFDTCIFFPRKNAVLTAGKNNEEIY